MSIVRAPKKVDTADVNTVTAEAVVVGPETATMAAKAPKEVMPSKAVTVQVPQEILGVAVVMTQGDLAEEVLAVSMLEVVAEDTLVEMAANIMGELVKLAMVGYIVPGLVAALS